MKKENVFRVGDKVWHPDFLWFEIERITPCAYFVTLCDCGEKLWIDKRRIKSMSFTEYEINASQVRPFEDGDILYYPSMHGHVEVLELFGMCIYFPSNGRLQFQISHKNLSTPVHATDAQKQLLFDRLAKDNLKWNPETKQLEELNEPRIGDTVVMWNAENPKESTTIDTIGKIVKTSRGFRYYGWANVTNNAVKWDGTKKQFDRIREGGKKEKEAI